jgi:Protein of unknown function (DUF2523)
MPTLFAFLASAVGPLAMRVLVAVGFASVSFAGVSVAADGLLSYAQSSWAGLPAAVLQLASLCGMPTALGIVFGSFSARVGLWAAANGTKLIFKG